MKIFSASQIRNWDAYTIENEPVSSIDLMERAATACADWLTKKFGNKKSYKIFCGKGNNGGDGLAIYRILIDNNFSAAVYIVDDAVTGSEDFEIHLSRIKEKTPPLYFHDSEQSFPEIDNEDVVIDCLFGTGLNKKPVGIFRKIISHINKSGAKIIAIDMPSGMYADSNSTGNAIIYASYTLTFQQLKLAFLMAENESCSGEVIVLEIGLSRDYYQKENSELTLIDDGIVKNIYIPRKQFANKGNYGYACLIAGSYGMIGAAILSAKSCLRSGVGKLTCYICKQGYTIMQTSVPEAMCKMFGTKFVKDIKDLQEFSVIGIGPGIGKHSSHKQLLETVFTEFKKPIVIDADGLNVLSKYPSLYKLIPTNSIITPHPKEFERLFGNTENDFERMKLALKKAKDLNIFIVLKGHHTFIASPDGKGYFNSTGNSGMATAGSGDVLTGVVTALLAQKYSSLNSCLLGVYLHGLAGDFAAKKFSGEAMIARDIIENLGEAFMQIEIL
ncbi:MAG: NAD(P)H-hydrate dehydratase [Ginsengibacter sp.]